MIGLISLYYIGLQCKLLFLFLYSTVTLSDSTKELTIIFFMIERNFFESPNSGCAFFNPHLIKEDVCIKNRGGVIEHIQELFLFHVVNTFNLAPYIAR
ncbi:hypothetical protein Hanom_Chr16g01434721 [Helianthus anomalus]